MCAKTSHREPSYKLSVRDDMRRIWRLLRHLPDPQNEILADLHPSMPRTLSPVPASTIHHSVFDRIVNGTDRYAPVVALSDLQMGRRSRCDEYADPASRPTSVGCARMSRTSVWTWVWLRRVVYFLTVFATAFVAFIPYFVIYAPGFGRAGVGGFANPIVNAGRPVPAGLPRSVVRGIPAMPSDSCRSARGRNRRLDARGGRLAAESAATWRVSLGMRRLTILNSLAGAHPSTGYVVAAGAVRALHMC